MTTLISGLIGIVIGAYSAFVYCIRSASGKAMRREAEADSRAIMRKLTGFQPRPFPIAVCEMSPMFCEIYEQSMEAERAELHHVAGIGFGRSLEFLLKDYAISVQPSEAEQIKKASLTECVNKFVPEPGIRDSAQLATWLRNDETHYTRRHIGMDVSNLKQLINLTSLQIQSALAQKAIDVQVSALRNKMSD